MARDLQELRKQAALTQREPVPSVDSNDISAECVDKTGNNRHEPVAEGEIAAMIKALRRGIPEDYPYEPIEITAANLLERTDAARMAAETELAEWHKLTNAARAALKGLA